MKDVPFRFKGSNSQVITYKRTRRVDRTISRAIRLKHEETMTFLHPQESMVRATTSSRSDPNRGGGGHFGGGAICSNLMAKQKSRLVK